MQLHMCAKVLRKASFYTCMSATNAAGLDAAGLDAAGLNCCCVNVKQGRDFRMRFGFSMRFR